MWYLDQLCGLFLTALCFAPDIGLSKPTVDETVVFAEENGLLAAEAEHFFAQRKMQERSFYLQAPRKELDVKPDGDPSHVVGASGGAYLEILPDTRRTHADKLTRGVNFSPEPGKMAVLSYKVHVKNPGRYYVWVRAYSTGSEDNGLHVGLDGKWPESGQRLQWCQGKNTWRWESKQRTEKEHCGEPYKIYLDIEKAGPHTISFSMREDGFEFDKWLMTKDREFKRPTGAGPEPKLISGTLPKPFSTEGLAKQETPKNLDFSPTKNVSDSPLQQPREANGDGTVTISGELRQWHKINLDMAGPFAHEQDNTPNPFTDYRFDVTFTHADGASLTVPGYFAADGDAGNSGAQSGTVWRAHFAPPATGEWSYRVSFKTGEGAALSETAVSETATNKALTPFDAVSGSFEVAATDKVAPDLRAKGQLRYVGKRYLQFAGTKQYFLKVGADAPETLLAYKDFDNTVAGNKKKAPLKSWSAHVKDWRTGDPTWQNGKGKGLIGAINYLSGKGCNAFSFLTYNAGGDGDNIWPFIHRDDKLHYDCSKLDQWATVLEHGTSKGMYLHFKLQETENDDHTKGADNQTFVPTCLDGGNLGPQRRLYCRELVARFAHNLALNWNLGEENTQTTAQQTAMIDYIAGLDAYDHNIVVHTYPNQQDKVYGGLVGDRSQLTGVSLQNSSLETTHAQTVKWINASAKAGKPWVVAFDESGSAAHAQCPDLGYQGFDGKDRTGNMVYTQHKVRKQTLWGTLMAGGAGNEYYFGYQFAQNDIVCEDWRSRDQSWDYCRIAIEFFHRQEIPFWEMQNADELVGNPEHKPNTFCFAKKNSVYVVYNPGCEIPKLDLSEAQGEFQVHWYNPRAGGDLQSGSVMSVKGGKSVSLGEAPSDLSEDWVIVLRK